MFSHNSGQHRSRTLAFELFRFWLRIRGDIRKGLVALCHSFWNLLFFNIHSYNTITLRSSFTIRWGPSSWILIASSLSKGSLHRDEIRTRACLTASRRTTNWAAPHPKELRRILLSCAASSELRCIRNRKSTPRIGESGSRRLPASASRRRRRRRRSTAATATANPKNFFGVNCRY